MLREVCRRGARWKRAVPCGKRPCYNNIRAAAPVLRWPSTRAVALYCLLFRRYLLLPPGKRPVNERDPFDAQESFSECDDVSHVAPRSRTMLISEISSLVPNDPLRSSLPGVCWTATCRIHERKSAISHPERTARLPLNFVIYVQRSSSGA